MNWHKVSKRVMAGMFFLLVAAQFVRPEKANPPIQAEQGLEAVAHTTSQVTSVLQRACFDCHSNRTEWPWYSNVAPVSWFVIDHVNHGRRHLNFSEWGRYHEREKAELLVSIGKTVKSGEMPLKSYNLVHPEARLTDEERTLIEEWAQSELSRLAVQREEKN